MIQILQRAGIIESSDGNRFRLGPAIVMIVLLFTFFIACLYVLISSLS